MTLSLGLECVRLIHRTAKKYDVPACLLTAHVRSVAADEARKEVWTVMIGEYGMRRHQVARLFGRDLRRVRKSVIGV